MSLLLQFGGGDPACPGHIDDHVARALARLTSPIDGPNIQALVSVLATRSQDVEDLLCGLIILRFLEFADGVNLDQYGAILGEPRAGWDDVTYRRLLRARVLTNRSEGTIDEVTKILALLVGVEPVRYLSSYAAGLELHYTRAEPTTPAFRAKVARQMTSVIPAGVKLHSIIESGPAYFGFEGDPDAQPFNVGYWSDNILVA